MKPAARVRNPIVPRNTQERTGAGGILRRCYAEINRRYAGLRADVLATFGRIPVYSINDIRGPIIRYGLTPENLANISEELQQAVDRWISAGREVANIVWYDPFAQEAAQLGTAQSVANLTQLSATYAAARSLEAVIYSEPYRNRIALAKFRNYEGWYSLAAEQRTRLAQVIGMAVADGQSPRAARKLIVKALDASKGRAMLYAQTDITGALREARWAESDHARDELGIKTAMLWTSAFLPTTRPHHAALNGRVRTTEQVRAFYSQGGNRYRCHCAQTECLLDENGKPILTKSLQSKMANERKTWQSLYDKD